MVSSAQQLIHSKIYRRENRRKFESFHMKANVVISLGKSKTSIYKQTEISEEDMGNPLNHRPRKRFGQDRSPALIPHVTQSVTCLDNSSAATFADSC